MKNYNKLIISGIIIVVCAVFLILFYKTKHKSREASFDAKSIYIENYIFTKLPLSGKALIRIYGMNKSGKDIEHFPVVIKYYTKEGQYLGKDESDLLSSTKAVLKAGGGLNAQVNVAYPKNTNKVTIDVKKN